MPSALPEPLVRNSESLSRYALHMVVKSVFGVFKHETIDSKLQEIYLLGV